jgi:uncharacterized protein
MPDFANPFSGMKADRTLTPGELTRAIRLSLCAEEEAICTYEAQADCAGNALAARVLRDIANEERVHVGELQRLLILLLADEAELLAEGGAEVDAMAAGDGTGEAAPPDAGGIPTIGGMR